MAETIFSNDFYTDNSTESPDDRGDSTSASPLDPLIGTEVDLAVSSKDDIDDSSPNSFDTQNYSSISSSDGIVPKLCLSNLFDDSFEHCHIHSNYQQEAYTEWIAGKKAAEDFKQGQRYEYLKDAFEHSLNRAYRAQEAFKKWKAAKDEISRNARDAKGLDKSKNDPLEKEKNFQAWIQRKNAEQKARREATRNAEIKRIHEEHDKKLKAEYEYDKWLRSAKTKPKSVPMGQGLLSLRGTASKIYLNPNEWIA